jgi:hypothetical protein
LNRARHPKKEIEDVLKALEAIGGLWTSEAVAMPGVYCDAQTTVRNAGAESFVK